MKKALPLCIACLALLAAFWAWMGRPQAIPEPPVSGESRLQCVSYAPFQGGESPYFLGKGLKIPDSRLKADMELLSRRFSCVRVYSPTGLERLPEFAREYGLKLLLGAWVSGDAHETRKELRKVIALAKRYPESVQAVIVGNEALLRKEVTGEQLANYLRRTREELPGVPVTYADVWEFWLEHPEVAPHADFITIHILPYWENDPVSVEGAMRHAERVREKAALAFPGKEILIGETGWPSQGRMRAGAFPSPVNQARYIRGFVDLARRHGWQYNLIEAFDQPWKRLNEGAVGGSWGLYDTRRGEKGVFEGPVSDVPDWRALLAASSAIVVACFLLAGVFARGRALSWAQWTAFSGVAAVAAVFIPLHAREALIISRFAAEYRWAFFLTALVVASLGIWIRFWAGRLPHRPIPFAALLSAGFFKARRFSPDAVASFLHLAFAVSAALVLLGFVFDFRYRSFPYAAFAALALVFASLAALSPAKPENAGGFLEEKILAALMAAGGLFVLYNETPLNWQANAWVAVCAFTAYGLWRRGGRWSSPRFSRLSGYWVKTLALAALAGIAAAVIRFGLMESPGVAARCAVPDGPAWCGAREGIGLLIHYRYLAWIGLLTGLASYAVKGRALAPLGLAFSMAGLTLYNLDVAAYGFLISLLGAARLQAPRTRS